MTDSEILITEGMNRLYSGMMVVFTFLLLLILSINVLRLIFSSSQQKHSDSTASISKDDSTKIHHRIINEILGDLR